MKITEEMVEKGARALWADRYPDRDFDFVDKREQEDFRGHTRAVLESTYPLIARAEAEECAGICQRSIEADNALRDSSQVSAEDVMIAVLTAKDIQIAIRARHATTPLASKEEQPQ